MLNINKKVSVERSVDFRRMKMISDALLDAGWHSGNREYVDMRGLTWEEAEEALTAEIETTPLPPKRALVAQKSRMIWRQRTSIFPATKNRLLG